MTFVWHQLRSVGSIEQGIELLVILQLTVLDVLYTDLTILSAICPPTEAKTTYGTEMVRKSSPVWLGVRPN